MIHDCTFFWGWEGKLGFYFNYLSNIGVAPCMGKLTYAGCRDCIRTFSLGDPPRCTFHIYLLWYCYVSLGATLTTAENSLDKFKRWTVRPMRFRDAKSGFFGFYQPAARKDKAGGIMIAGIYHIQLGSVTKPISRTGCSSMNNPSLRDVTYNFI